MQEKYVITLYKKEPYNEKYVVLKKCKVIKDATVNFNDDFSAATFYDENKQKIVVECRNNPYVILSDDAYCYDYPMTMADLKDMYPAAKDEEELIKKYDEEMEDVLEFSYYNKNKDSLKIFTTNEEKLNTVSDSELFKYFSIEYDSEDEKTIKINKSDLSRMIIMLKKKQNKKLIEKLANFDLEVGEAMKEIDLENGEVQQEKPKIQEEIEKEIKSEEIEDMLKPFADLIGLDNIKEKLQELIAYLIFKKKTKEYLKLKKRELNLVFLGKPGTGKTTVARIIADILTKLGYSNGKFEEAIAKDLIGQYIGETAIKTQKLIDKVRGGVLFIDEAYALTQEKDDNSFNKDAVNVLLKEMEKNDTIFIFSGYKKEMGDFIKSNSGLASRMNYYEFKDYTVDELYKIFEIQATNIGFIIDPNLKPVIISRIQEDKVKDGFGNGRYIEKLINEMIMHHSKMNLKIDDKEKLITLVTEDIPEDIEKRLFYSEEKVKKLGFQ